MNPNAQFERDLEQWLEAEAPASAPAGFHAAVMERARTLRQRPGWATTHPAGRFGRGRGLTLLAAAALLLVGGALAAGSGLLRQQSIIPPVTAPSLAAVAPSPKATSTSPSNTESPTPSATAAPIVWTQASLQQDWPAPVRPEPAGRATAAAMPPTYIDPSGDTGSNDASYVDIRDVTASPAQIGFDIMSNPPDVDPSQAWIAYGLVVDTNGDGVPDVRYGIDNLPQGMGKDVHRAWRTDLHTGLTEFDPNPEPNAGGGRDDQLYQVGKALFGTGYPAGTGTGPQFRFFQAFDTPNGEGKNGARQTKPFYVWASAIVDGQVVATDYAPDTGWLIPTPNGAHPGGTYVTGVDDRVRLTMNVPDGWTTAGPSVFPSTGAAGLGSLIVDHPGKWACDASGHAIKPPVGPTVDDLATFLAQQRMLKITADTDVALDGYRGKYLEYTASYDLSCQPPEWPFENAGNQEYHQMWILDVNGVRLVIDAFAPKASDAVTAEFRQIVDSIAIEPTDLAVQPTPAPTPTPTPTPAPTPGPTPLPPMTGPVPQGARPWTVKVINKRAVSATFALANGKAADGSVQLCGSVTPNVVPPDTTENLTFELPPKSVECWIFINPGPGDDFSGPGWETNDKPMPGYFELTDGEGGPNGGGQNAWVGP